MKQPISLTGVLLVLLSLAVIPALGQEKMGKSEAGMSHSKRATSKSAEETVRGEVIDLWCYLDNGDHGAGHKDCALACAKGGEPIGILDSNGNVYVAMGNKAHKFDRDELISRMAETVTVTGRVVKKGGMEALYIASIK
jgi:hypothetical protein